MSDQAPAPRETPGVAGPDGTPGAQDHQTEVDWQKRYADLQPEYTRTSQEAAELRQWRQWAEVALTSDDADTRRQAIEALGYAPADEEVGEGVEFTEEYEDPWEAQEARLRALEERLDRSSQESRMAEENALIQAVTEERLSALDGLDKDDQDWVLAYAINALPAVREPGVSVPLPDIKAAYEAFQARETARQKAWATTKRAPYVPPGGQEATEIPNLDTHQGRVDHALRLIAERQQLT